MAAIGGSVPEDDRRGASPVNNNNTGNTDAVYGRNDVPPGDMMARLSLGNNNNNNNSNDDNLRNNGSMNNDNNDKNNNNNERS